MQGSSPTLDTFVWFKYAVYLLLAANVGFFLVEEWRESAVLFGAGVSSSEIITAFAATIDTFAWVVLLLLFELETYQIPDERLTPGVTAALRTLRAICYGFIVYAFYGYVSYLAVLGNFAPVGSVDLCAEQGAFWLDELGDFASLATQPCAVLTASAGDGVLFDAARQIYAAEDTLGAAQRLAWVDVINSAAWLLVVFFLELDVVLLRRTLRAPVIERVSHWSKRLLYAVLLLVAVYWGLYGKFIDFWDAFLWIVAFVFIESNVNIWEDEIAEAASRTASASVD